MDSGTRAFLADIKESMPNIPDQEALCVYMGNEVLLAAKIPIAEGCYKELCARNDHWREFLDRNARIDNDNRSEEIEDWLKRFASGHERGGTTELEMEQLQHALIDIFSILGLTHRRNATSKGFVNDAGHATRPDFSCIADVGVSVFHGEAKADQDPHGVR